MLPDNKRIPSYTWMSLLRGEGYQLCFFIRRCTWRIRKFNQGYQIQCCNITWHLRINNTRRSQPAWEGCTDGIKWAFTWLLGGLVNQPYDLGWCNAEQANIIKFIVITVNFAIHVQIKSRCSTTQEHNSLLEPYAAIKRDIDYSFCVCFLWGGNVTATIDPGNIDAETAFGWARNTAVPLPTNRGVSLYKYSVFLIYIAQIIIPPEQRSCWGVYWFHSVRLSVRLSVRPSVCPGCRVRSVTSTVLDGFFPY